MLCESKLIYGVAIRRLEEGWKGINIIRERFFKKVLRIPIFVANEVAELLLGRWWVKVLFGCETLTKNSADAQFEKLTKHINTKSSHLCIQQLVHIVTIRLLRVKQKRNWIHLARFAGKQ
jgi:hypothetical protein